MERALSADLQKMERALSADVKRVASSFNKADSMHIQLLSNDSSLGDAHIRVPAAGQIARDAIEAAYATTLTAYEIKRLVVSMAGEEIDMETDFVSNGIEDGARLEVCNHYALLCFCVNGTVSMAEMWVVAAALHRSLS